MFGKISISILLLGCAIVLGACSWEWWQKYPQDNIVEEIVEGVIEHETGLDIDLTPMSPEKGFNFGPNPGD